MAFAIPIQLPQTGQTKCWNWQAPWEEIPCTGTGQDGDYQTGVPWPTPRFIVNGDCVTDTLTGLMWARNGNLPNSAMTWNPAIDFVNDLILCDSDDWRLPNINELESLVNINGDEPDMASWLMTQGFTNVQVSNYWSSTTKGQFEGGVAWIVDMHNGNMGGVVKESATDYCYVLPVRSDTTPPAEMWKTGQTISYRPSDDGDLQKGIAWPDPRFTVNGDCVTDNLTGLMWTKNADLQGYATWHQSLEYAKNDNSCGYDDWRLPNRKELMSLIDRSHQNNRALPFGHPFVNVPYCCNWSSSTRADATDYAWFTFMGEGGDISYDYKPYDHLYVWLVRRGTIYSKLAIHKTGSGIGTVISNPAGIDCGNTCTAQSASFVAGTAVTLTAIPENNTLFAYWLGGCTGTMATCDLTMTGHTKVTAHFVSDDTKEYKLKIKKIKKNSGDGTVTGNDGNIDCGHTCTHTYYKDTIVTLSATANDNSTFLGWKSGSLNCIGTDSCTVTIDKAKTVQATFVGDFKLKVVNKSRRGGTGLVSSTPSGISCSTGSSTGCEEPYGYGEEVTLSASADSGSTFLGWSPAKLCPGTGDCIVLMDKKRTVKAVFSEQ